MALVGEFLPWLDAQFHDSNGQPLAGGYIMPFVTGTGTFKPLFSDALLTTALPPSVDLDADGRVVAFMTTGGYDFAVYDENDVLQYTREGIESYGSTFLATLGNQLAAGGKSVTSGYTVLATDVLVTVNSTGGANPCIINLPAAADHPLPITIKNLGSIALSIVPNGVETIDGIAGPSGYNGVPAASAGPPVYCPSVMLVNDGISAWYILAGFSGF